jgi:hypothetical protein
MQQHEYFLNRQVQLALYGLKRQYGGPIVVYHLLDSVADSRTGKATHRYQATRIGRAAILPMKITREMLHNRAMLNVNRLMAEGGGFDTGKRLFVIDRRDAPALVLEKDDWIAYQGCKYAIVEIDESEFGSAYAVIAKKLLGETVDPALIQSVDVNDTLDIGSQAEGEVE